MKTSKKIELISLFTLIWKISRKKLVKIFFFHQAYSIIADDQGRGRAEVGNCYI